MLTDTPENRQEALRLLRSGRLEAARKTYQMLLSASPEDADLVGRLAQVAQLEGRLEDAENGLRRSLRLRADPRIRLRNLFELGMMLRGQGRDAEMLEVAAAEAPEWPETRPAGDAWRGMVLWLVQALIQARKVDKARRLLNRAIPDRSADRDALVLDGRLALVEGNQDGSVRIARSLEACGADDAAAAMVKGIMRRWAGYLDPPRASHRATILVCNPAITCASDLPAGLRDFHFCENFPAEFARRMQDEYRFLSVFADLLESPLPEQFHQADVVLNNVANAEDLNDAGRLDLVRGHIDRTGLPVINHPDDAARMTRENNARLLADIPGLKVPRVARYCAEGRSVEDIVSEVGERFDFPLIVRTPSAQSSSGSLLSEKKTALLVPDAAGLRAQLERSGWRDFYVVEFVDLRRDDGFYRKLRAAIIDREIIVTQAAMYREWMVSGWRDKPEGLSFYRENPRTIEECNRIVLDPEANLGAAAMEALQAIRDRLPLDMFGVDFEVDRAGRMVLFEASPVMLFRTRFEVAPPDVRLPEDPLIRVDNAFRDLVARRIADGPGRPA